MKFSSAGLPECHEIVAQGGPVGECVGYIIAGQGTTPAGKSACLSGAVNAGDGYLTDCLLGLSGQSHFGGTMCKFYYNTH
jgi:hypothetical protein